MRVSKKDARQVIVVGLDGTPHSFLKSEIEAGNLPHMAELRSRGQLARMDTEIPTISSVAWASFMTGVNPGEHGIFGFTDRRPGAWELYFPNYSHVRAEPLWDRISGEGGRCCVLNVPSTYPARALNGVLVSGFVAPSLERAVYPADALEYLRSSGYRIDVDAAKGHQSLDILLEDLHETLEKRREAMLHFWARERWDFFMNVFTGTDRLHHFFWRHYEENDPVYKNDFLRYYRRLDEIIGEFVSEIPDEAALFMLSDHGFCGIKQEVFPNRLLEEKGLLALGPDAKTIADVIPEKTLAYCLDPGRIYFNRQGREPGGRVNAGDAAGLADEVEQYLMSLLDPEIDEPVVERVETGGSLFEGPLVASGPDLVAVPRRGYDLKGRMSTEVFKERGVLSGMHTHDDAFVFIGSGIEAEPPDHIRGLSSLLLKARHGQA